MRHIKTTILLLTVIMTAAGCSKGKYYLRYNSAVESLPAEVLGMKMIPVEASCFTFNAAPTGRPIENSAGKTPQVFQTAFWISETTVSYDLWKSVMKDKPLSYDNFETFLDVLYTRTKIPFIVPSESMLEAALNQGVIEITNPIFTSDDWTNTAVPEELETDWRYINQTGNMKTVREPYNRIQTESYRRGGTFRFHVAVQKLGPVPDELKSLFSPAERPTKSPVILDGRKTFTVNGVSFNMNPVEGGTAFIGATPEQERYADDDEKPAEQKSFKDFYIGETEVTLGLWHAVMGTIPSWNDQRYPDKPVTGVSWYDTKEFIQKLNALTGQAFRLPDEDEWEYAARGGQKTRRYVFSGGNSAKDVAIYTTEKRGSAVKNVKTKHPNELGLYDMSGNVWEWVQGLYDYQPKDNESEQSCVLRGGSCSSRSAACRVSNRQPMKPGNTKDTFGFRLAL